MKKMAARSGEVRHRAAFEAAVIEGTPLPKYLPKIEVAPPAVVEYPASQEAKNLGDINTAIERVSDTLPPKDPKPLKPPPPAPSKGAMWGARWKDSEAQNPLPYDPVANLPPRLPDPPRLVKNGNNLELRRARDADRRSQISDKLLRNYIVYRTDPASDRKKLTEKAKDMGVNICTISKLDHVPGIYAEIRRARYTLCSENLLYVDEAMFNRASKGNVPAAKLMYERWDPGYLPKTANVSARVELESLKDKSAAELEIMASKILEEIRQIRTVVGPGLVASSETADPITEDAIVPEQLLEDQPQEDLPNGQ